MFQKGIRVMPYIVAIFVVIAVLVQPGSARATSPNCIEDFYKVQPGDNLTTIAKRYGISVKAIVAVNQDMRPTLVDNPSLIYDGWWLWIPCSGSVLFIDPTGPIPTINGKSILTPKNAYVRPFAPLLDNISLDLDSTNEGAWDIPTANWVYALSPGRTAFLAVGTPGNKISMWMDIVTAESKDPDKIVFAVYTPEQIWVVYPDFTNPKGFGKPTDADVAAFVGYHDRWWDNGNTTFTHQQWGVLVTNKTNTPIRFTIGFKDQSIVCANDRGLSLIPHLGVAVDWTKCKIK